MQATSAERAYEHIRSRIADGNLKPGQQLVNRTLAQQVGVSVIPVREALHRLSTEGLVEHIPGSGSFVRKSDRQELDQLYVLREALESCAASEAARFITEQQLDLLESILAEEQEIAKQLQVQSRPHATRKQMNLWLDTEQQFHQLLVEAARNPLLAKVTQEYRAIGQIFNAQRANPALLTSDVARATCKSKKSLLVALRNRDHESARRLMSEQIQQGRQRVITALFRNKG